MMWLENRVALVTGASRGIGAATAELLAAHGAKVGVNYFESEAAAQAVVARIDAKGGKAFAVQADARNENQVRAMVASTEAALGPIDTLVINAGFRFKIASFLDFRWEEFEAKVGGEMRAAFFPAQAVLPGMVQRKAGCIIAISSGLSRYPGDGFVAHTTAKSALDGLAKSLAHEFGPHGIRVNVVSPGLTITDATAWQPEEGKKAAAARTPLRRIAMPDDVAGAVLMLASDAAKFVTGAYLPASGGVQML